MKRKSGMACEVRAPQQRLYYRGIICSCIKKKKTERNFKKEVLVWRINWEGDSQLARFGVRKAEAESNKLTSTKNHFVFTNFSAFRI